MTRWAARTLAFLVAFSVATPAAAQWCDFDISVYTSGGLGVYYPNGDRELHFWGSGYDYSDCGLMCYHAEYLDVIVESTTGYTAAHVYVEGNQIASSAPVASAAMYRIETYYTIWCACMGTFVAAGYAQAEVQVPPPPQCVTPTLAYNRGMRPYTSYRYAFQPSTFTGAEEQGIRDALANWQAVDDFTGLGTTFQEVGWADTLELAIVRGAIFPQDPNEPNPVAPGAAIVDPAYGEDWFLDSAAIVFNSLQQFAFTGGLGVRKGTRHEAGHLHALNDVDSASAPSQSSVMLAPIAANDAANQWPDYVTSCDADRAYQAQFLPGFP